jgi:hypothetical protein
VGPTCRREGEREKEKVGWRGSAGPIDLAGSAVQKRAAGENRGKGGSRLERRERKRV